MGVQRVFGILSSPLNRYIKVKGNEPQAATECSKCHNEVLTSDLKKSYGVCPACGHYFTLKPASRISMICDPGSFRELNANLKTTDPLQFPGYGEKLEQSREKTGQSDAVVTGTIRIDGRKAAVAVLDSRFFMGSMGVVVGEKIVRIAEYAGKKKLPLIIFSASGGARMQEGLFSLMQMARTSAAVEKFKEDGGLYISVLTHPTTGGVSASFANLGDIILAEPKALIGFAGPRVIEQTIGQKLPAGFQRAEFQLEHGMVDRIVERKDLKNTLSRLLYIHQM